MSSSVKYEAASSWITPFLFLLCLCFCHSLTIFIPPCIISLSVSALSHLTHLVFFPYSVSLSPCCCLCTSSYSQCAIHEHLLFLSLPFLLPLFLTCICTLICSLHLYSLKSSSSSLGNWITVWVRRKDEGKVWRSSYAQGSVERNNRRHLKHVLLCVNLIFLYFHVFIFIILYFLYGLHHQSLMYLLASVSWKLSHVQNAYL